MKAFFAGALLVAGAAADCANSCSGHGECGDDDVCNCYANWQSGDELNGGDCSDRTCPFEIAWIDRPQHSGHTHRYAECSNRGLCDRSSGVCECFEGYTGASCQRTTCPNDCSGHGTCEYLADLPFGEVVGDYGQLFNASAYNGSMAIHPAKYGTSHFGNHGGQDPVTFKDIGIPVWDQTKSRMCVCDAKWTGIDCSRRMCPKGNDITDTRPTSDHAFDNYYYPAMKPSTSVTSHYNFFHSHRLRYQIQDIYLYSGGIFGDGLSAVTRTQEEVNFNQMHQAKTIDSAVAAMSSGVVSASARAHTFALTFTTNLNETYTTAPIELKSGVSGCNGATCGTSDDAGFIANALLALPNKVIDGVSVTTSTVSTASQYYYKISVTFTGDSVQGRQNLLEVEDFMCGDGCTPKRTGLKLVSPDTDNYLHPYNEHIETSYVVESTPADWNSYECGRRGRCDYDTGLCECFQGYYGEACHKKSAIV